MNGLDLSASGEGEVAGICECSEEPSGSIQCRVLNKWEPVSFSGRTNPCS